MGEHALQWSVAALPSYGTLLYALNPSPKQPHSLFPLFENYDQLHSAKWHVDAPANESTAQAPVPRESEQQDHLPENVQRVHIAVIDAG